MKSRAIYSFYLAGCLLVAPVFFNAQQLTRQATNSTEVTAQQVNDANIQLMRQDIRSERKTIVAANMPLTETEAPKFWPVYDRYMTEVVKVNDIRYAIIKEYAQNYQTMTDEQADSFIKRWLALDQDTEFEKVISHKKTATFFQIDRRIGMLIELRLASQVPLLQP